jgi:hypothetical protein
MAAIASKQVQLKIALMWPAEIPTSSQVRVVDRVEATSSTNCQTSHVCAVT